MATITYRHQPNNNKDMRITLKGHNFYISDDRYMNYILYKIAFGCSTIRPM